ncbi:lactonase family protein [Novosphingobium umbonatum]|uniref:Lactonase family protein n=1 Tax=Novosphingobium umbonatum TaxID=1908524 RepID=A0A437MZY6_9SPHN|nr:lactonase family protein [Novosphingobium umbonatum]RVU03227.1 lactonase family protein [Novosphingobium umbonatum]
MALRLLAGLAIMGAACPLAAAPEVAHKDTMLVYIGTQADAIWLARLDRRQGRLSIVGQAAPVARPTWLTVDADSHWLFSVSETGTDGFEQGGVVSYAINPADGALTRLSRVTSGGSGPTYLAYAKRQKTLLVGNFWGGEVTSFPVRGDGRLWPYASLMRDTGKGAVPKQSMPHAHATVLDPTGHFVLVPDMGVDRVFIYRLAPKTHQLQASQPAFATTPPGTGPRHGVFSRDGRFFYLLTELSAEMRSYRWDAKRGRLTAMQALPLDPAGTPVSQKSAAEIALGKDGRFLYASNRIRSTIVTYALNQRTGLARQIGEVPTGGSRPRSFAIDPSGQWMIVGNQESQTISLFRIDQVSGALQRTGEPVPLPTKPVAFAFYP